MYIETGSKDGVMGYGWVTR